MKPNDKRQEQTYYGYMLYDTEGMPHLRTLARTAKSCWRRMTITRSLAPRIR